MLLSLGLGVHASPGAHDALDVLGGAGAAHGPQLLLSLARGHAGQLADLRVRELAAGERLRQERQGAEGAGDPDVLAGSAGRETRSTCRMGYMVGSSPHRAARPGSRARP